MNTLAVRLFLCFVLASILTMLPLPAIGIVIRPAWVLLLVLYIQCFLSNYFRVWWVFLLGLYLDVMSASMMGEHAFAMLITTWVVSGRIRHFKYYSVIHQMGMIASFCLIYQFVLYVIHAFLGHTVYIWQLIGVPLTSTLVWPWLRVLLPVERGRSKSSQWSYYDL